MTEHGRALLLATLLSESLDSRFTVRTYGSGVYLSTDEDEDICSLSAYGTRDWTMCIAGGLEYLGFYGTPRQVHDEVLPILTGHIPF